MDAVIDTKQRFKNYETMKKTKYIGLCCCSFLSHSWLAA